MTILCRDRECPKDVVAGVQRATAALEKNMEPLVMSPVRNMGVLIGDFIEKSRYLCLKHA